MTLIASCFTSDRIVQVADRRVSAIRGKNSSIHNDFANKTIILLCRDSIVSMSYCGLAYIDGISTDVWLADKILNLDRSTSRDEGLYGTAFKKIKLNIRDTISRINIALSKTIPRKGHDIQIMMNGYRLNRGRIFPISLRTVRSNEGISFIGSLRISRFPMVRYAFATMGDIPSTEEIDKIEISHLERPRSENSLRDFMIDIVKQRAVKSPFVSGNVIAVTIYPPIQKKVDIYFDSSLPHTSSVGSISVEVNHHPWVITPQMQVSPSHFTGDSSIHSCGWEFNISGAAADSSKSGLWLFSTDGRGPPAPR